MSAAPLKLDLGAGTRPREGFIAVDSRAFAETHIVCDLAEQNALYGMPDNFLKATLTPEQKFLRRHMPYVKEAYVPWPWDEASVDEVHCSHMLEHLTAQERIHFANELHRVLKPKSQATIIVPHWTSSRAYGDLTHQWPPVSEFWACYLNAEWRKSQAPHNDGYTCDFDWVTGFSPHPMIAARNQEFQQFAAAFYKEAVQDLHIVLTKRG